MAVEFMYVKYDQLLAVANEFRRQSDCIQQMSKQLQSGKSKLDQSWRGEGYDKFNLEMNEKIFPQLKRLAEALDQASKLVVKMDGIIHQGEQEGQKAFPNY